MRSPLIITFTGIQLFFWLVGSAQKDKVDSLKMLFAGLRDTARIDVLNQIPRTVDKSPLRKEGRFRRSLRTSLLTIM